MVGFGCHCDLDFALVIRSCRRRRRDFQRFDGPVIFIIKGLNNDP